MSHPLPPSDAGAGGLRRTWLESDRRIPRVLLRPLQEFLRTSTAGGILLALAVVAALAWANSPWAGGYEALWHTPLSLRLGSLGFDADLHFWVNEGLMTVFFLLVGLEIKREFTSGELNEWRAAALPTVAAIGGMALPALLYLAVTQGPEREGWGVPMATDIAFALGALTLAAAYAPASLKPLLLTLAIVDDIGAILVIAIFYSRGVDGVALAVAGAIVALVALAGRAHVRSTSVYVLLGVALWASLHRAGVHPTIAGVLLGLLTPTRPFQDPAVVRGEARRTADDTAGEPEPVDADAHAWLRLAHLAREAISPLARVEHAVLGWSSYVILPLFALANAGVRVTGSRLEEALTRRLSLGIFLGLVVGKPFGVLLASWLGVRSGLARRPGGVRWAHLGGLGLLAGIGFTMALFVADLAFAGANRELLDVAKIAILLSSLIAGGLGYGVLRWAERHGPADAGAEGAADASAVP